MNSQKGLVVFACVLLVVVMCLTVLAGHLMVPEGKTSLFWAVMLFLGVGEAALILGGLPLWGGEAARKGDFGFKAILWACLGGYLLASLCMLGLKAVLGEAFSDGVFAALMILMLIFMVVIYALFTIKDHMVQAEEAPRQELRQEEGNMAASLKTAIAAMAAMDLKELDLQQARERTKKQIETCLQALEHAQGRMQAGSSIAEFVSTILVIARSLPSSTPNSLASQFQVLSSTVGQLKSALAMQGML